MGTLTSPHHCSIRLLSPQVLLCMQDLAAICAELHPREPRLRPPRVPAATGKRRLRHGGARGALSLK